MVLTDNAGPDLPLLSGTLEGQSLVLETDDAGYDFNDDGTDDPAHVSAVFVRWDDAAADQDGAGAQQDGGAESLPRSR